MKNKPVFAQALLAGAIIFASHAASAADATERRITALEARVTALEKQLSAGQGNALAAPAMPAGTSKGAPWRHPDSWKKLRKGMNEKQVREILGEPESYSEGPGSKGWNYQDGTTFAVVLFMNGGLASWNTPTFPAR